MKILPKREFFPTRDAPPCAIFLHSAPLFPRICALFRLFSSHFAPPHVHHLHTRLLVPLPPPLLRRSRRVLCGIFAVSYGNTLTLNRKSAIINGRIPDYSGILRYAAGTRRTKASPRREYPPPAIAAEGAGLHQRPLGRAKSETLSVYEKSTVVFDKKFNFFCDYGDIFCDLSM